MKLKFIMVHFMPSSMYKDSFLDSVVLVLNTLLLYALNKIFIRLLVSFLR